MIHVGDMYQKKKKTKLFLYPVVLQVVCFLRSSRTCSQNNVCIYQHEFKTSESFATEKKRQRDKRCQIGMQSQRNKQQTWFKAANTCFSITFELPTENLPPDV